VARFQAEVWVNDEAVAVDPEGETEWDATVACTGLSATSRTELLTGMEAGEALVRDEEDYLKDDRLAPAWVREWTGPFSIWVRRAVA
jgi:hypothetical protein